MSYLMQYGQKFHIPDKGIRFELSDVGKMYEDYKMNGMRMADIASQFQTSASYIYKCITWLQLRCLDLTEYEKLNKYKLAELISISPDLVETLLDEGKKKVTRLVKESTSYKQSTRSTLLFSDMIRIFEMYHNQQKSQEFLAGYFKVSQSTISSSLRYLCEKTTERLKTKTVDEIAKDYHSNRELVLQILNEAKKAKKMAVDVGRSPNPSGRHYVNGKFRL